MIAGSKKLHAAAALAACGALLQCAPPPPTDGAALESRIDRSLRDARAFLVAQQSDDGAWRSTTYGTLADGPELTPTVLKAVMLAPGGNEPVARGVSYLLSLSPDEVLDYPVYTAALSVILFNRAGRFAERDAWADALLHHQLTEALGWRPEDAAYGGWGYSVLPARRPDRGRPPFDSDLSSTLFAVGALRLAGVPPEDPAIRAALQFVKRCQNDTEAGGGDGGFFLTPTNEAQNKAGTAPLGGYRSYGSATADGLRALLRCGLAPDHRRVRAARAWLDAHFSATTNPGDFVAGLAADRDAAYYYWCWSVSHAWRLLDALGAPSGHRASELANAVLDRQLADGAWRNQYSFLKEDDPLIATSLAAAALANCHALLWPERVAEP